MGPADRRIPSGARRAGALALVALAALACGPRDTRDAEGRAIVTFPGSSVGDEAELLRDQLAEFMRQNPDIRVLQRRTPDAADQRHQLYVQWLNARAADPDVLQLDVVWTPEFAAAGWVLPLDAFAPDTSDFFPAALDADRWRGRLHALPWFVDVGMLYWRSDLIDAPPDSFEALVADARRAGTLNVRYGWVFQGARYEGLVTVFVEMLAAFGGAVLDPAGHVVVDSPQAVRALTALRDAVSVWKITPREALTWHEEQTRFAFQNGHALFMRNWPYAYALMERPSDSRVAGRFGVAALPPSRSPQARAAGARAAACLGGSQLAINARSDVPEAAWRLVAFLTSPERMRERAVRLGQYPPRPSLYADPALAGALAVPPAQALRIIEQAVARPATPVYTQLSGLLQIGLHRALSGQQAPAEALADAARAMRTLLERTGLAPDAPLPEAGRAAGP